MTDDERIMAVEAFLGDRKYWEHSVRMFIEAAEKEADKIIKEYLFAVYGSGHDSSDMEIIKSLPDDFKKSREESKWNEKIYRDLRAAKELIEIIEILKFKKSSDKWELADQEHLSNWELARIMIALGASFQILLTDCGDFTDDFVRSKMAETGRRGGIKKRDNLKAILNEAVEEALKLKNSNDGIFSVYSLDNMIDYLLTGLYKGKLSTKHRTILRKELKPHYKDPA